MYIVNEMFLSIQGEGYHTGRAAVFCRFSGCNLWTGREDDRASAQCRFCDTKFVGSDPARGGGRFETEELLVTAILCHWNAMSGRPFVVLTGGEPLLQVRNDLVTMLKSRGAIVAVETNGTLAASDKFDWITVSPKGGTRWVQKYGHELKLVWPQEGFSLKSACLLNFRHFYLQPKDGPDLEANIQTCIRECQLDSRWRVSLQTQKYMKVR